MGSIKDRNGLDLAEAGDIKKRWQEYKDELYKKDLHDPDNHGAVITNLEPDMLESEKQESSRKTSISALLTMLKPWTMWITTNWKILQEMGISDHLTCLLQNLYAGQEATNS